MILAALLLAAATLAFAARRGARALALARAWCRGSRRAWSGPPGLAAISDVYPQDELGLRMGLAETAGGGFGLAGPLVGGALIDAVGHDATFSLAASCRRWP